jgi:hypothetical protein
VSRVNTRTGELSVVVSGLFSGGNSEAEIVGPADIIVSAGPNPEVFILVGFGQGFPPQVLVDQGIAIGAQAGSLLRLANGKLTQVSNISNAEFLVDFDNSGKDSNPFGFARSPVNNDQLIIADAGELRFNFFIS